VVPCKVSATVQVMFTQPRIAILTVFGLSLLAAASVASDPTERPEIERLAAITNSYRTQQNLPRLVLSPSLCQAAQLHAEYMAAHRKQTHDEPGSIGLVTVWDRTRAESVGWIKVGENICHGYPDSDSAFTCWVKSTPHRTNIVDPNFTDIGLGCAVDTVKGQKYWVMDLAERRPRRR
jgi:uncharacterized protein YkwD